MKIAEAFVEVRADTTGFVGGVHKAADTAAGQARSAFKNLFAGIAIGALFKGAFSEIQEAEKSAKQLEQTIRSTGGAAGITAKHAQDLADAISKASVVDDELVASTENVLLRFTAIKNSGVDKTFDRTTQAAIDMAAAMGKDGPQAAALLGKALEDPVAGANKLARAQVILSDAQKKQIETFVAQGDTAKAQGVILGQVEKEFGGQAAAAATDADKAKVAFQNLEESLGRALLPVINDAAKALTVLSDAFSAQPGALQQIELGAIAAAIAYAKFGPAVKGATASLKEFQAANTALKSGAAGAAGPVAIAAGITLLATAGAKLVDSFAASKLRNVKGNIDDITLSLQHLAEGGTGGFDIGGLNKDLDTLDSTAGRIARNPVFAFTPTHGAASSLFKAAKEDVDALDKSLAATVESGHADKAKQQLQALADQGVNIGKLKPHLDDYTDALTHNAVEAGNTATKTGELGGQAVTAADSIDKLKGAVDKYTSLLTTVGDAQDAFQGALNQLPEITKAVRDAGEKFGGTSDQAIAFRNAQRDIVSDASGVIQKMSEETTNVETLKAARKKLADQYYIEAIAAGVPTQAAKDLRRSILNIPTTTKTTFELDGAETAMQQLRDLQNRLNQLGGGIVHGPLPGFGAHAAGGMLGEGWNLVGEQGPELLSKRGAQVDVLTAGQTRGRLGGAGTTINVTVNGVIGDQEAVGRHLVGVLNDHQKRYGR